MVFAVLVLAASVGPAGPACLCPGEAAPDFAVRPSGTLTIVVCGGEVYQCGKEQPLIDCGYPNDCSVERSAKHLVVTESQRWPFGPGWSWVKVPWRQRTLALDPALRVRTELILKVPVVSPEQLKDVLALYKRFKRAAPRDTEKLNDLTGRLLAAALAGYSEAQRALWAEYEEVSLDGYYGETYQEALDLYQAYARATGKVPVLK